MRVLFLSLLGVFLAAASASAATNELSAVQLIRGCRAALPLTAELSGRIVLRNRKGISQAEYAYVLTRTEGKTDLKLTDADGQPVTFGKEGRLMGTDVTWSDLTLDYLWWNDISWDAERESESVHGQVCSVVLLKDGARTVRVWIDRKTGALMQAEELCDGQPVRRLWGTRIKKFDDRWMANVLEVETLGSGHRTKITVETLK